MGYLVCTTRLAQSVERKALNLCGRGSEPHSGRFIFYFFPVFCFVYTAIIAFYFNSVNDS